MSADETPAGVSDLARAVRQAREELLALSRTVSGLAAAYDRIPVEDLSEADRAARIEIIDSLSDVQLDLNDAAESFESAVWNADCLGARPT